MYTEYSLGADVKNSMWIVKHELWPPDFCYCTVSRNTRWLTWWRDLWFGVSSFWCSLCFV